MREGLTKAGDSGRAGEWTGDVFTLSLGDLLLKNIDVCIDKCIIANYFCVRLAKTWKAT